MIPASSMQDRKQARRNTLKTRTQQDILKAAVDIIARQGMQALTMDRVALETGVAKGTLYIHFKNKKEIFDAAISMIVEPLFANLLKATEGDRAPIQKLSNYSRTCIEFFDRNHDFFRVMFFDRHHIQEQRKRYHNLYNKFVGRIAGIIDEGIRRGDFRSIDSVKLAAIFIESNLAVVMQRLDRHNKGSIDDDVNLVVGVFMNGIAVKGLKK
jgi:AcrR family transcriptional regulator